METDIKWKADRKVFSQIGINLSIFFLMMNVVQVVLFYLGANLLPTLSQKSWFSYFIMAIANYGISFPVFCILMKRMPDGEVTEKKSLTLRQFLGFFCISYAMLYIGNIIGSVINTFIGIIKENPVVNPIDELIRADTLPYVFVITVILAPAVEEIIFRKLILNRLRCYGDRIAIFVTALTFGLLHGNLSQFFYAFFLGLIFGYIAVRTNQILYTILLHIIINAIGSGISPFILYVLKNNTIFMIYACLLLLIVIIGIVVFFREKKKIYFEDGIVYLPPEKKFSILYGNPGMIIYFILCALSFLLVLFI